MQTELNILCQSIFSRLGEYRLESYTMMCKWRFDLWYEQTDGKCVAATASTMSKPKKKPVDMVRARERMLSFIIIIKCSFWFFQIWHKIIVSAMGWRRMKCTSNAISYNDNGAARAILNVTAYADCVCEHTHTHVRMRVS